MNSEHNMDHLNHIEAVAASDCVVLRDKEATYQGSWKRAGGRSAWFMARRNIDRLITMMGKPEMPVIFNLANVDDTIKAVEHGRYTKSGDDAEWAARLPGSPNATVDILKFLRNSYIAEDIFAKIEAEPSGSDGTPLAVIRDLRRYLILVEAEMVSRGVVQQEQHVAISYQPPAHDVYQLIADEKGIPRDQVKNAIHALFYDEPGPQPPLPGRPLRYMNPVNVTIEVKQFDRMTGSQYMFPSAKDVVVTLNMDSLHISLDMGMHPPGTMPLETKGGIGKDGVKITAGDNCTWTRPEDNVTICVTVTAVTHDGHPIISNTNMEPRVLNGWSTLRKDDHVIERRGPPTPRSPEAGSHHSSLYPWEAVGETAKTIMNRIGKELFEMFYNRRGTDHYRLEPVVRSHVMPRELTGFYRMTQTSPSTIWLLTRSLIPADLIDEYPTLQIEMNSFEYEQSQEDYKFMYLPIGEKWTLQECFMEWGAKS